MLFILQDVEVSIIHTFYSWLYLLDWKRFISCIYLLLPLLYKLQPAHIAIINSIQKMQIQLDNCLPNTSLFVPINSTHTTLHHNQTTIFSGPCSLSQHHNTNHHLRIIANTLILEHHQQLTTCLELTFQVKFQVLYEIQRNVRSTKKGIRLYNQSEKELKIFLKDDQANIWTHILEKRINQKGFHEMFKPIKKLGKGNFATVYQAERLTDKVRFAVKAFSKQNSYSAKNGKESLINELTVLRELNKEPHQNVLKLQAVYESDNSIYVVLELLAGQTLFQLIQERKGHFSNDEIKKIVGGLLSGLKHIHQSRVMHRDLKPQNIMVRGESLEPVIVDFGLATNADVKEYLFFRCGTPGYVAPEIIKLAQSEHVQPICDIFSLGAIFHILLVRKPLFEGTKYDQVYRNNKSFNFKLEGQHFTPVDKAALDLLRGMLILNPNQRRTAADALCHQYFLGQIQSQTQVKISSPIFTESGSLKKQKKKKMFLFF